MNDIERLRKKINGTKKRHKILTFLESILILFAITLSFLIYAKNDENGFFLQKYFNVNISFKSLNDKIGFAISKMLSNFNIFNKEEDSKKVSTSIYYQKQDNNYYSYSSLEVPMLFDGKVLSILNVDNKYSVNVYYSNGVNACYYELTSNYTKKEDLLSKGDYIGTYEEKFKVIFAKNDQIITYEEALLF